MFQSYVPMYTQCSHLMSRQQSLVTLLEFSYPNAACAVLPSRHIAIILTAQKCCTRVLKCLPAVFGHRPAALVALRRT